MLTVVVLLLAAQSIPAEPEGCRDLARFGEVADALKAELEAAWAAAGRDGARAAAGLDAAVARYDPCYENFAADQQRRFEARIQAAPESERAAMRERGRGWLDGMRNGHKVWRDQIVRNGDLLSPPPPRR